MAEIKYAGLDALEEIAKHIPKLIGGDNIEITVDENGKTKISSTGGGSMVYVGDTEPEAEGVQLWIDTSEYYLNSLGMPLFADSEEANDSDVEDIL